MAKYEMTWMQQPHKVSLGAEKNFAFFTSMMAERKGFIPDERYFRHLVSKAILFRRCDGLARDMKIPGYKANVVTYTVSWLSYLTNQRLDLESIWNAQDVSEDPTEVLEILLPIVIDHIIAPPRAGMNITEWCKREDCWKSLKEKEPPFGVSRLALPSTGLHIRETKASYTVNGRDGNHELTSEEQEAVEAAQAISAGTWFSMSNWGARTGYLQPRENSFLYQMGQRNTRGQRISFRQARWALQLRDKAQESGFREG